MVKRTICHGRYQADLYVDPKLHPPIYHYIITRAGEAEVLMWGQENSVEEAEDAALSWMQDMSGESKSTVAG